MSTLPATIIIPAYNEANTISPLLKKLLSFHLVSEIIVVNDGSTDQTAAILQRFSSQIKIITLPHNQGKSQAIVTGIQQATQPYLMFCDADLTSITKEHITALLLPLINNFADQVLAIRDNDFKIFATLTGERAYRKQDLLPHLHRMQYTRFGLETYLNHAFANKRTYYFFYPGLTQLGKANSLLGKLSCLDDYLKEGYEILLELSRQKQTSFQLALNNRLQKYKKLLSKLTSTSPH